VKEEEADWLIYHQIVKKPVTTPDELVKETGLDAPVIEASLSRLENYLLITRTDGRIQALDIGDSLLRCQIRYSSDLPLIIENGIIKQRKQ
jgi:hypothetical protein